MFKEKSRACRPAPVAHIDDPFFLKRTRGRAALAARDHPVDAGEVEIVERSEQRFERQEFDARRGPPQLVDGGFNGWWIPPSGGAVDVSIRWTAQTPLTAALLLTIVSILGCLVLIALDRRHTVPMTYPPVRLAIAEAAVPMRERLVASGVWVVAAGLLVGPGWALVAAVGSAVLVVVGGG